MKKLTLFTALILNIFIIGSTSCKNDNDAPTNPIDQLPPATQTGENTIGYLLNGKPISITNSNEIGAFYQQLQLQIGGDFEDDKQDISITLLANGPLQVNLPYGLINNY